MEDARGVHEVSAKRAGRSRDQQHPSAGSSGL
jgi:hypothetical protein